ncbi:MAG: histidine kinase [Gemmatimonadota bacterium]
MPTLPEPASERLRSALRWAAFGLVALGLGLLAKAPELPFGNHGLSLPRVPAAPPDLPALLYFLGVGSTVWYAAALAVPLLLWFARRLDTDRQLRAAAISVAVMLLLVVSTAIMQYEVIYGGTGMGPGLREYFPVALRQTLLPWIAVAGIVAGLEGRRRSQRFTVERERLRALVAEQRLIALTGQLQPHFLFNTLQGISTLIHRDPVAADEMLLKLSDLLRDLLRHRDQVLVSLGDELRYARTYLEISQLRFGDRLQVVIEAPHELAGARVPLFLLQPLVENALTHGIGGQIRGGRVTLTVRRNGERLRLEVADDGVGLPADRALVEGIGLRNTRARLEAAFGSDQRLVVGAHAGGGTSVAIDIPYLPLLVGRE